MDYANDSATFFRDEFHFLEDVLDDAGGVGGGGKDAANEHVAAKVLVTYYLATTKVLNPEMVHKI